MVRGPESGVFINSTLALAASVLLQDDQERLDALQRLVTHEVGQVLGPGHPNTGGFDTDLDPLNAMPIDPADPYADLFWQPNYDPTAVMAASPCGGGLNICPGLFVKDLQPDGGEGCRGLASQLSESNQPMRASSFRAPVRS